MKKHKGKQRPKAKNALEGAELVPYEKAKAPVAVPPPPRVPEPFSPTLPPLVPGQAEADVEFAFWHQEREIDALRSARLNYQRQILKLNNRLIEVLLFFRASTGKLIGSRESNTQTHEVMERLMAGIEGELQSQDTLLEDLYAAGVDVHPALGQILLQLERKGQP